MFGDGIKDGSGFEQDVKDWKDEKATGFFSCKTRGIAALLVMAEVIRSTRECEPGYYFSPLNFHRS